MSPAVIGLGFGLSAALIWGAYLAMAKAGLVAGLVPADIALLRYAIAGVLLLPWLAFGGARMLRELGAARVAILVALAGPPFVMIGVGGYAFAPLAHGAIIQPAALTFTGVVLAAIVLGDRPHPSRIVGIALMGGGLMLVAGSGLLVGEGRALPGDAMFATAGAMWALFTVLARRWRIAPLDGTALVAIVSAMIYVPIHLALFGLDRLMALPTNDLLAQAAVQGILSGIIAVAAFAEAVRRLGASRATAFPALVPAVAMALGVPLAGELPTSTQLLGLAVVTAGLLLAVGLRPPARLLASALYRMNLLRSEFFARSPTLPRT